MEKTNVTLRIEKEVIDKARSLGINLSSITENFLKTEPLASDAIVKNKELRTAYRAVFKKIIGILKEWEINQYLKIGEFTSIEEITSFKEARMEEITHGFFLNTQGKIEEYVEEFEHTSNIWSLEEDWPIKNLFSVEKIISNLIGAIHQTAEENKLKIEEVKILNNFLENFKSKKDENTQQK